MKLTCLQCGHAYEVVEGAPVQGRPCPACGTAQDAHFPYARSMRFEAASADPLGFARSCAREGLRAQALEALEEAFRAGYHDWAAVEGDPDLATLRGDPRLAALVSKYRKP
jgi:predicted  nucleic acid-binding Zn-ribbon protein